MIARIVVELIFNLFYLIVGFGVQKLPGEKIKLVGQLPELFNVYLLGVVHVVELVSEQP
jgi:hypothetical protein